METFTPNQEAESSDAKFRSNSLSGGERHRLFLCRNDNYKEFTLVSGVDFREDGRGFSLFDFDRDGYLDMAITSPNYPRFRIVRNTLGDRLPEKHKYLEVALVGGQETTEASTEWSPRDPFGARVLVTIGGRQRMFHLSLGEGLSGQNAKRIHIGLGQTDKVDSLKVIWPSGKTTVRQDIQANQSIVIRERESAQE